MKNVKRGVNMVEVNDIIKKLITKESLTERERFKILNIKGVSPKVIEYLSQRFQNLIIEVCGDYEGNIFELMQKGYLEGWCWQTTESSIVFLNDNDYIERGNLKFEEYKYYYHSWICFTFENQEYVFDPCLDLLCKKSLYSKIFEPEVKGKVTAKEVRNSLIDNIENPKIKRKYEDEIWKKVWGDLYELKKKEIQVSGDDNVNSPMYRNNTGYNATIENGKIKKLIAHYYGNG